MSVRRSRRAGMLLASASALILLVTPGAASAHSRAGAAPTPRFTETDLVSNIPKRAALTDAQVVNAWGLALGPATPLWVANNGTKVATIYTGATGGMPFKKAALEVAIPGGPPTGQAFNGTDQFVVTGTNGSGPARFLFVSEQGALTGWSPAASPLDAIVAAHVNGAIYKGLALLPTSRGPFLLAADFHHNRIDVFDGHFHRVTLPAGRFRDPTLPAGYAPFNVFVSGDSVYVSYAKQDADAADEVAGPGKGFVDRYTDLGRERHRIASRGSLNAPWGMAIAPASFGRFAGHLLVGNFGDGRISVFDRPHGGFDGLLRDRHGKAIVIDGLWALLPGNATAGGADSLWFSAGPDDESAGLVGLIRRA